MNVDLSTLQGNLSAGQHQHKPRYMYHTKQQLKHEQELIKQLEEQRKNETIGLKIEKSPNKAKLEVSMININNQAQEAAKLTKAQQNEHTRGSPGRKKSFNDVTTLAGQSNAFNMTFL